MPNLLLHATTAEQFQQLLARSPQSILISGPAGIGKSAIAQSLAEQLLGSSPLEQHPYVLQIKPVDRKQIGIDTTRQLEHFLSLKIPGDQDVNRVVLIHDAHTLSGEAQNALLKTLEEPPAGTVIVLTSANDQALLPTVRSRLQTLEITRPTTEQLTQYLQAEQAAADTTQILAMSDNLPGLAIALQRDDQRHPMVAALHTARHVLQQSTFEKLAQVDKLAKDNQLTNDTIAMLLQLSRAALLSGRATARWHKVMAASYQAQQQLGQGGQSKLLLTNLMLNL